MTPEASNRLSRSQITLLRLGSVSLLLLAWEITGLFVSPLFLSPLHETIVALWTMTADGTLLKAAASSLTVLLVGLFISAVFGTALGLLIGRHRKLRVVLEPYINGLYATPTIAFLPMLMAWFGLFMVPKIAIVVLLAIFPILKNTLAGVSTISREYLEPAESMSASEMQIFRSVIIPAVLPFIMAGLRLAIGRGIVGVVVGEFLTAQTGLGGLVVFYASKFQTAEMFVPILVLVLIGVVLTSQMKALQIWLSPWKESERDQGA
jgi:NitT/TauT family transport system permease protein